jgi:hypothetical protein
MARIGHRDSGRLNLGPGSITFPFLVLVLVAGLFIPSRSEGAKLSQYLTPKDLSRPLLLDQNGIQLQLPSPSHPHPSVAEGSTPTYLAVPLYGGEHLPVATATIDAGAQAGSNGIGPLDLNSVATAELKAALNSSGFALVDAPGQNYLVEYLPHLARAHKEGGSSSSSSTDQKTTSSSTSTLSKLLTLRQWSTWADSGFTDLKKLLNISTSSSSSSSKNSTSKPSLNLEAQILGPDNQTSGSGSVLPAAIPEPSGWMIFALLLGGSGLCLGMRRAQNRGAAH